MIKSLFSCYKGIRSFTFKIILSLFEMSESIEIQVSILVISSSINEPATVAKLIPPTLMEPGKI